MINTMRYLKYIDTAKQVLAAVNSCFIDNSHQIEGLFINLGE